VEIESECGRCLKTVRKLLEVDSQNQYRPLTKTDQGEIDDIGIRYYSEEYIDVSEDIREMFLLEAPPKVLCSEDCKGLCPGCGQDLNEEECNCSLMSEEEPDSKFADLVKMLNIKS